MNSFISVGMKGRKRASGAVSFINYLFRVLHLCQPKDSLQGLVCKFIVYVVAGAGGQMPEVCTLAEAKPDAGETHRRVSQRVQFDIYG